MAASGLNSSCARTCSHGRLKLGLALPPLQPRRRLRASDDRTPRRRQPQAGPDVPSPLSFPSFPSLSNLPCPPCLLCWTGATRASRSSNHRQAQSSARSIESRPSPPFSVLPATHVPCLAAPSPRSPELYCQRQSYAFRSKTSALTAPPPPRSIQPASSEIHQAQPATSASDWAWPIVSAQFAQILFDDVFFMICEFLHIPGITVLQKSPHTSCI